MFPSALASAGLGLLALLRGMQPIGRALKSILLRCLLIWPHVLRNLRRVWSPCSGTSHKDVLPKNEGGQPRPSSSNSGAPGKCEGYYSTIYASRDPNRAGEPYMSHIPMGPIGGQSQRTPRSPALSLLSSPGSPQRSDRRHSAGSAPSLASSHSADSTHSTRIRHLNTPLTLTHSRVTSTQFAGAPPSRPRSPSPFTFSTRSRSRPSSPIPSRPSSIPSRPSSPIPSRPSSPTPSPFLHRHPLPQDSTLENSGSTQISDVSSSQGTPEGSRRSSFDIRVLPPSRSQTLELNFRSTSNSPQASLSFQQGNLSEDLGLSESPTSTESVRSTQDPFDPRGLALANEIFHPSSGSRPAGAQTPSSDRARYRPPFPRPSTLQLSAVNFPVADASGTVSNEKTRNIGLMHSEQVSRYVKKGDVSKEDTSEYRLRPMEVDLLQLSRMRCPKGWVPVTHPGGALYFYNAERRIFTDVYMYDPNLSAEIHEFAALLDNERTRLLHTNEFPTNHYDLVLDLIKTDKDETIWAYYYVDHYSKTLFWLRHYECEDMLREVPHGAREASHVKLRLESLYWVHWSLYPTGPDWRRFPENALNDLLGNLLSSGIDSLTSKVSTSPYTVAEMESMRDFIKEAESLGPENPHVITSVARLLSFYAHWMFLHFHGQKASRQDRYESIYKGGRRKRTRLVRILSPILFFFPDVHLLELEKVWTDKIVVEALWKEFMQKLVSEWTEFVLYSTVMLAANVGFLAIPGVIVAPQYPIPPDTWIKPSPAQIASSISLVFSIGSIITGLLLIRRNRTMMTKDPKSAWHYLDGMEWRVVGLEPLAIVFSLTYALLMWSAWVFFVALLTFSFQGTSRRIWIPVGTAAGIVTMFIFWCIANTWDPEEQEEEPIELPYEPEPQVENGAQA